MNENSQTELQEYSFPIIDPRTNTKIEQRILCGYHNTDEGNARRFIAHWHHDLRYCAAQNTWYIWNGVRWERDSKEHVYERAKAVVTLIHIEASYIEGEDRTDTKTLRKETRSWAYKSESQVHIKAMVRLARSDELIAITPDCLNANLDLMNFPNGTLDFKKREFREHRREDLITMVTAAPYDPLCESNLYFSTLVKAQPPERIVYIQRKLGSMLKATTTMKEYSIVYGRPYALKSSVTQPFYAALGDYAGVVDISLLRKHKNITDPNAALPALAYLEGKRIAWSEETPAGMVLDDAFVKSITSSGKKSVRKLYENTRQIELQASFILETNDPPIFDVPQEDTRNALLERTDAIGFFNTMSKEDRQPDALFKLTHDENELTAALAFFVQGYFDREDYGLTIPDSALVESESFQVRTNPLNEFVQEEVLFLNDDEVQCSLKELFQAFKDSATREELELVPIERIFNKFFKLLVRVYSNNDDGVAPEKASGGIIWHHVRIRDERDGIFENKARVTNCDDVTMKHAFSTWTIKYLDFYKALVKMGASSSQSHFPTFLTPETKHYNDIISEKEAQISDGLECDDELQKCDDEIKKSNKNAHNVAELDETVYKTLNDIKKARLTFKDDDTLIGQTVALIKENENWCDYDVLGFIETLRDYDSGIQALIIEILHNKTR